MVAALIFVSHFLGLVTGRQTVVLDPGEGVRSVRLMLDGRQVATLRTAPWVVEIDLGAELKPQELTAVGYDDAGSEVSRATQILNIAKPRAELEVVLVQSADSPSIRLEWSHYRDEKVARAVVRVDGTQLAARLSPRSATVALPALEAGAAHIVSAEVEFEDGTVARREAVFGGVYSEEMPAELTAVAVRRHKRRQTGACAFRVGPRNVAPAAIEDGPAVVSFVMNGEAGNGLRRSMGFNDRVFTLGDAELRYVSTVATRATQRTAEAALFDSRVIAGSRSIRSLLLLKSTEDGARRLADAVAVAGLRSLGGKRRAVVYVVGVNEAADSSFYKPAEVRRYLERIGVPLHVWSQTGPRPDLAKVWGTVEDVSTPARLQRATRSLRLELADQRVAWIPASALDALRARAGDGCGYESLVRLD